MSALRSTFGSGVVIRLVLLAAAAILPACVAVNDRLFVAIQSLLTDARYDPIVNPGTCAGHVHSVYGSAAFSDCVQLEDLVGPVETTSNVLDNLSMYWAPSLYIQDPATLLYHLVPSFTRAYYRIHHDGNYNVVNPFPHNLRFLMGDASRNTEWSSTEEHDDIRWTLLTLNRAVTNHYDHGDWRYLKEMCEARECVTTEQIEMKIKFPECLAIDSETGFPVTDSPDHRSHGSYADGNACPTDFPYHIPELDLEVRYELDKMRPLLGSTVVDDPHNWVLSSGDTSGAGAHADLISGWDEPLMQRIILHCRDGPGSPQAPEDFNCPEGETGCCPITQYFNATRTVMQEKHVDRLYPIPDEQITEIEILPLGSGNCPLKTIPPPTDAGPAPSAPSECPAPPTPAPTTYCSTITTGRDCRNDPACKWYRPEKVCVPK